MATLIPALSTCLPKMTSGEKRLARRLEDKLEDDYLCWYDVPVGPTVQHPDFIVLHPRRGILILEVKDWRLDTIRNADRDGFSLILQSGLKRVVNPLEQARQYAHAVANALKADPQLTHANGPRRGQLLFPWGYGVVLPNISRRQFDSSDLGEVLEPHHVICFDEMGENVEAEDFQKRLWGMFNLAFFSLLSLPQIDRIRWLLFPEIRIVSQADMFDQPKTSPPEELLRVMDLQQEQLARSLGEGHRVIHGVAGSGKTLILGYRAEQLAKVCAKPILVLCYNQTLAKRLARSMEAKGVQDKVHVHHFHQWCRAQLMAYHVGLPAPREDRREFFEVMVKRLIAAVERKMIPSAQYEAVLIDEGHDFDPEWFKLVVQMVDPASNSLLVLYDDAQSIYNRGRKQKFRFKSVGIQAQGRTTILRVNYRNTREILDLASRIASDLLHPESADEDGVPLLAPVSAGRSGPKPQIIKFPRLRDEAEYIADQFKQAHQNGLPWRDMAVIYHDYPTVGQEVLRILRARQVPVTYHKQATFAQNEDTVKFLTMHSCKGLEFPLVAIPGVKESGPNAYLTPEDVRLLYVAMTRATHELMVSGPG